MGYNAGMSNPTFDIGDKVMSATDSSDRRLMQNVYRGEIVHIRRNIKRSPDGCAYHVRGQWDNDTCNEGVGVRQLWARNLEIDNGA